MNEDAPDDPLSALDASLKARQGPYFNFSASMNHTKPSPRHNRPDVALDE